MEKEELRNQALSVTQIPNDFKLVIEEYFEGENGKGEAMFSWTNKEQDEGITVNLDLAGNLTSLSIDSNNKIQDKTSLKLEKRRERAEQFLLRHYPDALNQLTYYKTTEHTDAYHFHYEQLVMDLPLRHAGCFIDVDTVGNIIKFTYKGVQVTPEIPTELIAKEKLVEHVNNRLAFNLTITNLISSIHSVTEDGLRLVYEIDPHFMKYKADVLKPTLTITHDEDVPETFVPLPSPSNSNQRSAFTMDEIVGITEKMEIIREVNMGTETGIVWRDKDWNAKEDDLSMDGFFKRHSEDTVKVIVSKKTGEIRSFIWFKEREGKLRLSYESCYQKAIEFLQTKVPNYYPYLQLIVRDTEEEDTTRMKESFPFHIHNGQGIPIDTEIVIVAVNRTTGQIDYYSEPSFDIENLRQLPNDPSISKKEAEEIFLNHLDFELVWDKNYESDNDSHILVFQACDRHTRTAIRYIDAMTGDVIVDIN